MRGLIRWTLGLASIGLVACNVSGLKKCAADAECGAEFHCEQSLCVSNPPDAGPCVGVSCSASSQCVGGSCAPRYTALSLTGPARTAAATSMLTAELTLGTGRTAADPSQLELHGLAPDGGPVATVLNQVSPGLYTASVGSQAEGASKWTASFPDAGLSSQWTITVDRTGPALALLIPPAPTRSVSPLLTELDPAAVGSWRRDERANIQVVSTSSDVLPASLSLRLTGIDGGWVTFDGGSACDAGTFCWQIPVDFAVPSMDDFRARFALTASGSDDLGNATPPVDGGQLEVTRLKWLRGLPDAGLFVFPGLDEQGNLYTNSASAGLFESFSPAGATRWSIPGQNYSYPPMVGASVVWLSAPNQRTAFAIADAGTPTGWTLTTGMSQGSFPALGFTVTPGDPTPRETAFAFLADPNPRLLGYRLGAPSPDLGVQADPPGSLTNPLIAGGRVWLHGQGLGGLRPYWVPPTGADRLASGLPVLLAPTGLADEYLLAATRDLLVRSAKTTGTPALQAFDLLDGGLQWASSPPDAGSSDNLGQPFIGDGDVVFAIRRYAGLPDQICRIALGTQTWLCAPSGQLTTLVLGEGGLIYLPTPAGLEVRRQSDLTLVWSAAPAWSPVATAILDCSRDATGAPLPGRPGVLYGQMTINERRLSAVIVDSRGVDATAPWPMFRHDPRNTANVDTPLTSFSCP